ncbi:trypsin-like peptidase domain-containing protein [Oscillibacter sp.]|uniref:S1C family serine protease n=1 Tax=Oscillibacter sp. TaxID=1945593 RepID=UPI0028AAA06B|nr:trypsin-like peptidase domain-containing protein [Oscillibacter sp.]
MNDQFFKIQPPDEQGAAQDGGGVTPSQADPREVVEYYPPLPQPKEVVELYIQPRRLPGRVTLPVLPNSAPVIGPILTPPVSKERVRGRRGLWIFLICLAIAGGLAVGALFLDGRFFYFAPSSPKDEYLQNEDWDQEEVSIRTYPYGQGAVMELTTAPSGAQSIQEIYRRVNPAVVTVIAQLDRGASVGTGMIFREDGYVLTNYHVVAGSHDCSVTLASGRTFEALYVGGDSGNDVAVLKLDATGLPAAEMGDSDALMVGDTVYAIGNPLGVELRGTLTDGIVSAINRDVDVSGRIMTLIQTNAALNEGNSGGPLINVYGQVVGVNTIKMMSFSSNVEGLGFALPMRSVQKMVNDILESGKVLPEPRLGITIIGIPKVLPDGTQGVEVQDVSIGSAADRAGVKGGDVIVSAGGQAVTERHMLMNVRRQFRIGDDMPMKLWRDGEYVEVVLHLDEAFEKLPAD